MNRKSSIDNESRRPRTGLTPAGKTSKSAFKGIRPVVDAHIDPDPRNNRDQYFVTADIYQKAAVMWLDMEEGIYKTSDGKWKFPPKQGAKVSMKEIAYRLDFNTSITPQWLKTAEFSDYLEVCRRYRIATQLPAKFNQAELIREVIREGLQDTLERVHLAKVGLAESIPAETWLKEIPKWARLYGELCGEIETSGVQINLIQDSLARIGDPASQQEALRLLSKSLQEELELAAAEIGEEAPRLLPVAENPALNDVQ